MAVWSRISPCVIVGARVGSIATTLPRSGPNGVRPQHCLTPLPGHAHLPHHGSVKDQRKPLSASAETLSPVNRLNKPWCPA